MSWTLPAFTALLALVGTARLIELRISRRRARALAARGAAPVADPRFGAMVCVHVGVLLGAGVEAWVSRRVPPPALAGTALALVAAANALRLWVIATLGPHWNVRIVASLAQGVVSDGPFRYVRHPNYVAVFVELLALPLVHAAYATTVLGAALHMWVLHGRVRAEEAMLLADPAYRAAMGAKPRFVPLRGPT
jgi:methyltransferase